MDRWCGRVALVTGAASGIGRAITIRLLEDGLNVFACDCRDELLSSIINDVKSTSPGELIPLRCDLRKEEEILGMFETIKASRYGGIDVCVNNAGVVEYCNFTDGDLRKWRSMLEVNFLATAICMKEALLIMKSRGIEDGHIVNISSDLSHVVRQKFAIYAATKHAVNAMTEGVRQELLEEKSSIRVTRICPAVVKTPLLDAVYGNREEAEEFLRSNHHLSTEDVVSAVVYVLSAPKHVQVFDVSKLAVFTSKIRASLVMSRQYRLYG